MPRARGIKPAFFKNDVLVELDYWIRLLFIGLWTLADRAGRLEDRPKRIKMELFAADDVDIDAGLTALHDSGFILRYEAGGQRFIQVLNFARHQSPHAKEPPSTIPPPAEHRAGPVPAPGEHPLTPDNGLLTPDDGLLTAEPAPLTAGGAAHGGLRPPALARRRCRQSTSRSL